MVLVLNLQLLSPRVFTTEIVSPRVTWKVLMYNGFFTLFWKTDWAATRINIFLSYLISSLGWDFYFFKSYPQSEIKFLASSFEKRRLSFIQELYLVTRISVFNYKDPWSILTFTLWSMEYWSIPYLFAQGMTYNIILDGFITKRIRYYNTSTKEINNSN